MISPRIIPLLSIIFNVVSAQTPPGFAPAVPQNLKVTYAANDITPPGKPIARPETATPPRITIPQNAISPTAKGIVFMIDLDVPRNNQRVTNLHWMAPNVDISTAATAVDTTGGVGGVSYRQPSPPPGDTPHRYVYLLYAQPAGFSVPPQFSNLSQNRLGFDVNAFSIAAGLGTPVAANFITVQQ